MRKVFLATLFFASLGASAAEVLDLISYFPVVNARKSETVYIHDIYDRNHVPRVSLVMTVYPGKFGKSYTDYRTYELHFKDHTGKNIVQSVDLDKATYTKFRAKVEKAKMETAYAAWTTGCALRAVLDNVGGYYGILSMCDENPAEDSLGTIEADSNQP